MNEQNSTSLRSLISNEDFTSAIGIAIKNILAESSDLYPEIMIEMEAVNNLYIIYLDFCLLNGIKPITLKKMENWHFVDSQRLKENKDN